MRSPRALIGGAGLGAGAMYFFDPAAGRRRRARMGDQLSHVAHQTGRAVDVTLRDSSNRVRGVAAELSTRARDGYVTDKTVGARVRAQLGLLVRHPHQVIVGVDSRCVTLRGRVYEDELYRLLDRVAAVPGAASVEDRLDVHAMDGADAPTEPLPPGDLPAFLHKRWSPATRLLAGGIGTGLAVGGMLRRDPLGAAFGLGLVVRAVTNLSLARLTGIGAGRRAVDIQKTFNVAAPVEQVFDSWTHYEDFALIMEHLQDVQRLDGNRSRWVVGGPLGCLIGWEAVVTRLVPNALLAWQTTSVSAVQHAGVIRFEPNVDGGTRVDIKLSYNPPGGALGHVIALLLGFDPKQMMDHDLVQLRTLIECGKTTAHHTDVTRDALVVESATTNWVPAEVGL